MQRLLASLLLILLLTGAAHSQEKRSLCRAVAQTVSALPIPGTHISARKNAMTGEATEISWRVPTGSTGNSYLVLGFPTATRFQGDGFVATPPQARAPQSIKAQSNKTRVIIPLTGTLKNPEGSLLALFYATGVAEINWEIVELAINGSGACTETARSQGMLSIQITSGPPQFITQDRFAAGAPKSTFISRDNTRLLLDFGDRYQIVDNQTGDLLFERSGTSPRFSPTGRYLTSLGGSNRLEIFDLAAQKVVFATDALLEGNFGGVAVAAWMNQDAVLVLAYGRKGALGITVPLVDDRNIFFGYGCNACHAFGSTSVSVDFDQLTVQSTDPGSDESQDYIFSLLEAADPPSTIKFWDEEKPEERGPPPHRPKYPIDHVDPVYTIGDELKIAASKDQDDFSWIFSDEIKVSFSNVWNGDLKRERALLASKTEKPRTVESPVVSRVATRGRIAQRVVEVGGNRVSPRNELEKLANALSQFSIYTNTSLPADSRRPITRTESNDEKVTKSATAILQDAMSMLAKNRPALIFRSQSNKANHKTTFFAKNYDDQGACDYDEGPEESADTQGSENADAETLPVISANRLVALWKFPIATGALIVAQQQTQCGTAPDRYGDLIAVFAPADVSKPIQYIRFAAAYSDAGDVSDPSGVDSTRAKSGASLGLDVRSTIQLTLVEERWLIVTSKDSGSAVVFDVPTMTRLFLIENLENALDIDAITMTTDHRTLVQLNNSGALTFYSLASGKLSLRGRFIDDETVLFDSALNFEATPEGASYVYVQVPGSLQLFTLDQFSGKLNSSGLGQKRIYQGESPPLPSSGLAPPVIDVKRGESTFVISTTSETSLSNLAVSLDGYLVQSIRLDGTAAHQVVPTDILGNGRWVSFVVEDKQKIKSLTRSFQISSKPYPGTLRVVSFGANKFNGAKLAGKRVPDLSFAASDAKRFEAGLKRFLSPSYSGYSGKVLANDTTSRDDLLKTIKEAVASTKRGDTLVLFFASHGSTSGKEFSILLPTPTKSTDAIDLPFSSVSEIVRSSQGRVLIFLDACHSADATQDAASEQLTLANENVVIISASKGRQSSLENQSWGGGIFTTAILDTIKIMPLTLQSTGQSLSIESLYANVRKMVVSQTNGRQTPWFRRASWQGEQSIN